LGRVGECRLWLGFISEALSSTAKVRDEYPFHQRRDDDDKPSAYFIRVRFPHENDPGCDHRN
jgi:hypothetical protein